MIPSPTLARIVENPKKSKGLKHTLLLFQETFTELSQEVTRHHIVTIFVNVFQSILRSKVCSVGYNFLRLR